MDEFSFFFVVTAGAVVSAGSMSPRKADPSGVLLVDGGHGPSRNASHQSETSTIFPLGFEAPAPGFVVRGESLIFTPPLHAA